jgi:hypothetical protein
LRRPFVALAIAVIVSACGSNAALKSAQSNKNVQHAETKVEKQVSKCMPRANGTPDPLLLRHHANLTKFEACTGVAKSAQSFGKCAFKVVLGGLPTVDRLKKGLVACVEQNL